MAADFGKPVLTDDYATVLAELRDNDAGLATQLDDASPPNTPVGAKRWSTANVRWEKYDGSSWLELAAQYAINVQKLQGYTPGNANGNIPLNNGTLNVGLNAEKLNGQLGPYYAKQTDMTQAQTDITTLQGQVAGNTSGLANKVTKTGDTMTGQLKISLAAAGNPLVVDNTSTADVATMFQGNLLQFFNTGRMLYARSGAIKWEYDVDNSLFKVAGGFCTNLGRTIPFTEVSAGSIELKASSFTPFIDFASDYSDYHYRIALSSTDRLAFRNWNGNYIEFLNDGNIYCSNRGYVWDAINNAAANGNNKVINSSYPGNNISFVWDGRITQWVDGSSWFMFGDPGKRIRTDWTWGGDYIAIKVDTDGSANRGIPTNPSDARIKNIHGPATLDALAGLRAMPVVRFSFKEGEPEYADGEVHECGLIAQDLAAVCPTALADIGGVLHVRTNDTLALLIRSVQQLADQVDTLRAEVAALKGTTS